MKNVVISGANRGIGLELTKQFAEDNIVYALCRSDFPNEDLNERIRVVQLDVTDEATIMSFAEALNKDQVAIDLLINNAGIDGGSQDGVAKLDMMSVTEVFSANTVGPMILTLQLTPALKRAERPVMTALSSRMGTHALLNEYNAAWWPYSASKAALSFAISAFALNEPDIKSISIHPGWVKTRMGGDGAQIKPTDSAGGIKKLYAAIDTLKTGNMYNYDGTLMAW